jgi:hypothetical protein
MPIANRTKPATVMAIPIGRRMPNRAPKLMFTATGAEASAFMITAVQLPSRMSHRRS